MTNQKLLLHSIYEYFFFFKIADFFLASREIKDSAYWTILWVVFDGSGLLTVQIKRQGSSSGTYMSSN